MVVKTKRVDNKHVIVLDSNIHNPAEPQDAYTLNLDVYLAKLMANGGLDKIPDEEPTILFRGRDRLALAMLFNYRELCVKDGCNHHQLDTLDSMIEAFDEFSILYSHLMKQPGITRGK